MTTKIHKYLAREEGPTCFRDLEPFQNPGKLAEAKSKIIFSQYFLKLTTYAQKFLIIPFNK
jgi:hypothetical protein